MFLLSKEYLFGQEETRLNLRRLGAVFGGFEGDLGLLDFGQRVDVGDFALEEVANIAGDV